MKKGKADTVSKEDKKIALKLYYWGTLTEEQVAVATAEALRKVDPYCNTLLSPLAQTESKWIGERPKVVCLCGSTRFGKTFQDANLNETMAGKIVLSIGCNMKSDMDIFGHLPEEELKIIKIKLDELHKRKIDLADEVLVLNVGGYIGESTRSEIDYAEKLNKPITYLEPLPPNPKEVKP